ncbi:cilia- and flagella-associated protein 20 isoform X1 [Rhinatrema bivittatum]|uniref:cilia- and flagella-associated protein 20 isoform X1 n=1 Tax=Rhinatrema bivittatum TaxID=194408 RepID=UPI0011263CDA|nr:cilia- and flagella-associated protein 20 isoform X1 [Rhinatrema bivittatum]
MSKDWRAKVGRLPRRGRGVVAVESNEGSSYAPDHHPPPVPVSSVTHRRSPELTAPSPSAPATAPQGPSSLLAFSRGCCLLYPRTSAIEVRLSRRAQRCSRTPSRAASCPSCTASAANRSRSGIRRGFMVTLFSASDFKPAQFLILYSTVAQRLNVRNGHIKRITDNNIQSLVLEIEGTNVSTTYITCPADPKKTLGIKLPFLVMIIKNLKKYFTFEVQVLDDKNVRRRFRASNYQSTTRVKPFICTMPMRLDDGWNQIQFNLSDFTRRAYGTNYIETLRVQIHANCRIRRVYFSDRLYSEDELPAEFKLYLPVQNKAKMTD